MWAELELCDEIQEFIDYEKSHNESFEEIRKLVFTKKRLNTNYSFIEIMNLTLMFQDIKMSAINKVLNKKILTFPEGFVIERLLAKYRDSNYISVEEHFKQIQKDSSYSRQERRKNQVKLSKLYTKFINNLF